MRKGQKLPLFFFNSFSWYRAFSDTFINLTKKVYSSGWYLWVRTIWCRSLIWWAEITVKNFGFGALFHLVGRAGVPCTEALSSLQWPQVCVPAQGPLLHVTHPLSLILFPVISWACTINKAVKAKEIHKKIIMGLIWFCCYCFCRTTVGHWCKSAALWIHPILGSQQRVT